MQSSQMNIQRVLVGEGFVAALEITIVLSRCGRSHVVRHFQPLHRNPLRAILDRMVRLHVPGQLVLDRESFIASLNWTRQIPSIDVPLNVFFEEPLLVERTAAHRALIAELLVHFPMLLQVSEL